MVKSMQRFLATILAILMLITSLFVNLPEVKADTVTSSATEASSEMNLSAYLGMDTSSQGAWNGKYGASGYLVVGQNGTKPLDWGYGGSVTDSEIYQFGVTDIYMQPTYVTNVAWANGNSFSPSPDDQSTNSKVLDLPSDTDGKTKFKAEIESGTDPLTIKVTVNDNQPHIFSTYTSTNWNNGATVQLLDAAGNLVASSPYIPSNNALGEGVYVSFMVQGSFQIRFTDTDGWASIAGFFFDEPANIGVPTELSATGAPSGRKINLAWANTGDYSSVVLERSTDNINFLKLTTFTGNETVYTDENLTPDQIYYYRLRNIKDGQYGVSTNSVSATAPHETSVVMNPSAYLGMNTSIQGAWNDKYGASGYLLVGQNGTRPLDWGSGADVTDSTKYQIGVNDIYVQPTYVTSVAWANGNYFGPSPDDHSTNSKVLDLPSDTVGKTKFKADIESRADPVTIKVTVNDNQPHIFSTYTSTNWGNGATVQLLDAAGNLIASSPNIQAGNAFGNGAYVSFMVQGSFQVRFAETGGWASMSSFFFDEPAAAVGVPTGLNAEATPTGRKINLTWTNAGDYSGIVLERSTNNINFSQISIFTGDETAYTDENLTPDQIYYYRLRNIKDRQYGVSTDSVSATVPPMVLTHLEITDISATDVNVGDSVTVSVYLVKDTDGTAIDGTNVYLKLTGSHVGDGETLGQEIPELLGTAVTADGGNA
ncbi:MAG TPA: fibronectin type III domain-containing protein, partial [Ruminiclostridium sp.]